jgi:hypothetical protein
MKNTIWNNSLNAKNTLINFNSVARVPGSAATLKYIYTHIIYYYYYIYIYNIDKYPNWSSIPVSPPSSAHGRRPFAAAHPAQVEHRREDRRRKSWPSQHADLYWWYVGYNGDDVVKTIINHPIFDGLYHPWKWWFWGWIMIALTTLFILPCNVGI